MEGKNSSEWNYLTKSSGSDTEIKISVVDPRIVETAMPKYVLYAIRGVDKNGSFEILRRYNDFYVLRSVMVSRWPGCYIPPLPEKQTLGNLDQQFIEDRRQKLDQFCKAISQTHFLHYSTEFHAFLRQTQFDIEKTLASIPITYEDTILRYSQAFSSLMGKDISDEILKKIESFSKFLKFNTAGVVSLRDQAKRMAIERQEHLRHYSLLINQVIPTLEREYITAIGFNSQYEGKTLMYGRSDEEYKNDFNNIIQLSVGTNEWDVIYQLLRNEVCELEAIADAIRMKNHYDELRVKAMARQKEETEDLGKLKMGKSTVKSFFSTKRPEEVIADLQKTIENTNKDIDNITLICDVIVCNLGYIEIDKFKQARRDNYFKVMQAFSKKEEQTAEQFFSFWHRIVASLPE